MESRSLRREDVRIASPCPASWDGMLGDDQVRYCHHCSQAVYNLSSMTGAEAKLLLKTTQGRMCVRYFVRKDGTIMTADCPVGLARIRKLAAKRISAVAALLLSLFAGMPALVINLLLYREINKPLRPAIAQNSFEYLPDPRAAKPVPMTGVLIPKHIPDPLPAITEVPVIMTPEIVPPQLVRKVEPAVPSKHLIKPGISILQAVITRSGAVDNIRVLRSLDPELDKAAADAIKQWRYKPALLNGASVATYMTVAVRFHVR